MSAFIASQRSQLYKVNPEIVAFRQYQLPIHSTLNLKLALSNEWTETWNFVWGESCGAYDFPPAVCPYAQEMIGYFFCGQLPII